MKAAILQPTYLPWLGYFEMIASADTFVVFDHVQFEKKSWQQRNRIKGVNGEILLTVPIENCPQQSRICDVKISSYQEAVLKKHWKAIEHSYGKAEFFKNYASSIEEVYESKFKFLKDLNMAFICLLIDLLNIRTKIIDSSDLGIDFDNLEKTDEVVKLCLALGVTHLYDAKGAQQILDSKKFECSGIKLTFQDYKHPVYHQLHGAFLPNMSVIDLLFNEGKRSLAIIKGQD